jgi:hypothetical protein
MLGDLVGSGNARADRGESVERLAEPAAGLPGAPSLAARRNVDQAGVTEDSALPIGLADLLGRAPDDERQLSLVHEDPRLGKLGQHDRVAGADDSLRVLQEHVERPRLALRVLPVIGDAAEDLAGARQGGVQPHRGERLGLALYREPFERWPHSFEPVYQPLHRQLRRMPPGDCPGEPDDPTLGQQAGRGVVAPRSLKEHHLHPRLLPSCPAERAN